MAARINDLQIVGKKHGLTKRKEKKARLKHELEVLRALNVDLRLQNAALDNKNAQVVNENNLLCQEKLELTLRERLLYSSLKAEEEGDAAKFAEITEYLKLVGPDFIYNAVWFLRKC